jgi:hypothetical protein
MTPRSGPRIDQRNAHKDAPHDSEIREQLGRILGSAAFRHTLRLTRFLTFVVEETLAGQGDRVKAYTVAVEALGRKTDFDPQSSPIVRVEAGRLRDALARYYAGSGGNDPLLIDVPRGGYVPTFRWRGIQIPTPPTAASRPTEPERQPDRMAEIAGRRRQLNQSIELFQSLAQIHRQQVEAMTTEILSAQQTLNKSRTLLQVVDNSSDACEAAPSPLPSATSAQPAEIQARGRPKRANKPRN